MRSPASRHTAAIEPPRFFTALQTASAVWQQRARRAATVVTCGAVLVQGLGRSEAAGVAWVAAVFGCEAAFTLPAVPVLGRHGAWGVSVHFT